MKFNGVVPDEGWLPSCPARGTWIEIASSGGGVKNRLVVPRKGHVD